MYRWQDPPTPAVSAIRERRMVRLFVAQHGANVRAETPPVPSMTIDGVEYVEAPEVEFNTCKGCALSYTPMCSHATDALAESRFGDSCGERRVIYIRKA